MTRVMRATRMISPRRGQERRGAGRDLRILTGLQGVVRHEVFDRGNHEIRVKYGGYEQREGHTNWEGVEKGMRMGTGGERG